MKSSYELEKDFKQKYSPYMDHRDVEAYNEAIRRAKEVERVKADLDKEDRVNRTLRGRA